MKIIALIPAYKPEMSMLDLLKEIHEASTIDTVVVNDGSGGEFKEIFESAKEYAHVIQYEVNRGKGSALKTGLKYIKDSYKEDYIVVTMDADGQHTLKDALKLCTYIENQDNDLVLGKRYFGKDVPLRSRFGNALTRLVYKLATRVDVYDTQTGLRAFSYKIMDLMLEIKGERYEYEMNVLMECAREHIRIKEIDIETIYINNNEGSHFNVLRDSYKVYKEIFKFCASSIVCFLLDYLMYVLFLRFTIGINPVHSSAISNVLARIISSVVNFTLNKKLVFKRKGDTAKLAMSYFALVIAIMLANTSLLAFLVSGFGMGKIPAKIVTEIVFFGLSWLLQKRWVFKRGN